MQNTYLIRDLYSEYVIFSEPNKKTNITIKN